MDAPRSFQTSGTIYPSTQRHIQEGYQISVHFFWIMIIRLTKNVRCQCKVSLIATTAVPNIQPRTVDVLSQSLQARKHSVSYCCRTLTELVMLTTDFTMTSTTCSFTDSHLGSLQIWTARTVLVQGIHKRMVRCQLNKPYKPHHSFVYALYFWNTLLRVRYKNGV